METRELVLVSELSPVNCVAVAFARILGINTQDVYDFCGHDGMERVREGESPYCFRGFHFQEMVDLCLSKGFTVTEIERYPHADQYPIPLPAERLFRYMKEHNGVVAGKNSLGVHHAVAWFCGKCYDGNNITSHLTVNPIFFWIIESLYGNNIISKET